MISCLVGGAPQTAHDIIIDHISASGGTDDIIDVWWNDASAKFPGPDPDLRRITFQNSLIAEAIAGHPTGMLIGGHSDLSANPPIIGSELIHHVSVHNNYFVHNGHRNPLMKSRNSEVINNVVYNWGGRIGGTGYSAEVDWINNYWKQGPMSGTRALVFQWMKNCISFPLSSNYIAGNIMPSKGVTSASQDNWFLFETNHSSCGDKGNPVPETNRRFTPLSPAPIPVTIQAMSLSMVDSVLADVGANKRLNSDGSFTNIRDSADQKFIDDFYAGTGPSAPPEAPTMPSIKSGIPYADSDHDGMADNWETIHGFNPNIKDGSGDADGDGYTNLEEYLNGM